MGQTICHAATDTSGSPYGATGAIGYGDAASNYVFTTLGAIIGCSFPDLRNTAFVTIDAVHVPVGATINSAFLTTQCTPVSSDNVGDNTVILYGEEVFTNPYYGVDVPYPYASGVGQKPALDSVLVFGTSYTYTIPKIVGGDYTPVTSSPDIKNLIATWVGQTSWHDGAWITFLWKTNYTGINTYKGLTNFTLTVNFTGTMVADTSSGAVLGGSATVSMRENQTASGGTILGGSAILGYTMRSTGGTILGGSAILGYTMPSTGGTVLGGTSRMTMSSVNVASSGAILGGTSTFTYNVAATGGGLIGGSAIFNAGVPSTSGAILGGSAALTNAYILRATGGLVLGGSNQGMIYPTVISLTAWILPTDVTTTGTARGIITKVNNTTTPPIEWAFEQDPDVPTELRFRISRTTISGTTINSWSTVNCGLTNTDWAFVVVTYDALSPPIFYKNGVVLTSF